MSMKEDTEGATVEPAAMEEDDEEDEEMKLALAMSMQQASSEAPAPAAAGGEFNDPAFVNSMLAQLPGVDPNDPAIQAALASINQGGEKKDDDAPAPAPAPLESVPDNVGACGGPHPRRRRHQLTRHKHGEASPFSARLRASRRRIASWRILLACLPEGCGRPIRENRRHRSNTSSTNAEAAPPVDTLSNRQCPPRNESAATRASPSKPSKNSWRDASSNRSACVHTKHALFRQARPRANPTATIASRSAVFNRDAQDAT